eukprot:scaffold409828_cov19-Prasinocladus_malaysianus.AAC.1
MPVCWHTQHNQQQLLRRAQAVGCAQLKSQAYFIKLQQANEKAALCEGQTGSLAALGLATGRRINRDIFEPIRPSRA